MIKELKNLVFIITICLFIFFTTKYYFSDTNKKNSYRSYKNINEKVNAYSKNIPLLKNDTFNTVKYFKQTKDKKKTRYTFWELINNDQ
tara:strand:+ start:406 stop:669 length:264 start_codon:yes stop_codon:yes gene_type:complete